MTRLINADVLKEYIDAQKGRPFIGCTIGEALKIMTDEQPTVEAIPIKWIQERIEEAASNGDTPYVKCLEWTLLIYRNEVEDGMKADSAHR